MSGGASAATIFAAVGAAAAVAGVAVAVKSSADAKDAQNKSQKQVQANADKTATQADQDMNKANQKQPDTMALLDAAQQAGKGGASGTMLTGPQGVDPNALSLGKTTLLGG